MPVSQQAREFVRDLVFSVTFEARPLDAIDRLCESRVYDPISPFSAAQRATQIEEVLQSGEDLTALLPEKSRHTQIDLRELMAALVREIRNRGPAGELQITPNAKLVGRTPALIEFLLVPLANARSAPEALADFLRRLPDFWPREKQHKMLTDHLMAVRAALKSQAPLSNFVGNRFAEASVRQYLHNVAQPLKERLETLKNTE